MCHNKSAECVTHDQSAREELTMRGVKNMKEVVDVVFKKPNEVRATEKEEVTQRRSPDAST